MMLHVAAMIYYSRENKAGNTGKAANPTVKLITEKIVVYSVVYNNRKQLLNSKNELVCIFRTSSPQNRLPTLNSNANSNEGSGNEAKI